MESLKRYERYKAIRRELAKQKNILAYLIFTNEELAILAKMPALDEETAKHIKGIAPSRLKDHIHCFYTQEEDGKEGGPTDATDSRQG